MAIASSGVMAGTSHILIVDDEEEPRTALGTTKLADRLDISAKTLHNMLRRWELLHAMTSPSSLGPSSLGSVR